MNINNVYTPSLRDFFHIIFKRKFLILIFFTGTVLIVGLASLLIKPTYKATAQMLVKIGRESLAFPIMPTQDGLNVSLGFNREEYINSEIQIIKSRPLSEKVVNSFDSEGIRNFLTSGRANLFFSHPKTDGDDITPDRAVLILQDSLDAQQVRKSNIIQVSFKHHNPQLAAETVNRLCNKYLEHHLSIHRNPQPFGFFLSQSEIIEKELEATEKELRRFKETNNISSLIEERSLLLSKINELQANLNQTISQKSETQKRIQNLKHQLNLTPDTILQGKEVDHNPVIISDLQNKLVELELQKKDLLTKYNETSRMVSNIEDRIRILRETLSKHESGPFGKSLFGVNSTFQNIKEDLLKNEVEFEALKARRDTQESQLKDYMAKIENMNHIETELARLEQKLELDRQNYRLYLSKLEESRISDAMDKEKIVSVSILESATEPTDPTFPNIRLNLFFAVIIGFFGGLCIALMAEYFDDCIDQVESLEKFLDVPVLGTIPKIEFNRKELPQNVL